MSDTFTFTFNETISCSWTLNIEPYAIDMIEIDEERKLLVQWEKEGCWEIIDEKYIEDYSRPDITETELYGHRNDEYGEEIKSEQMGDRYAWVVQGAFD